MRFASLMLWLCCLTVPVVIAAFVIAVIERSREKVEYFIYLLLGAIGLAIVQWLVSLQTKCPLCITPVLAAKSCSKNKRAKKFLGSYRLRVATNILTRNHFRCPYCSEPTELVARERRSKR